MAQYKVVQQYVAEISENQTPSVIPIFNPALAEPYRISASVDITDEDGNLLKTFYLWISSDHLLTLDEIQAEVEAAAEDWTQSYDAEIIVEFTNLQVYALETGISS